MIKCEMHSHSLGGSTCAKASSEQIISDYIKAGYNGIVLTNHYALSCWEMHPDYSYRQMCDLFFSLIEDLQEKGKKAGLKVFFGAESRIISTATEYMIYGFDKAFFYDHPDIIELTQEELYNFCNKHNLFMYQTHPFRNGVKVGNPKFMHGAEYYNGHFHHYNNNDIAMKFCEDNNLIKMVGTDYHEPGQPITTAMYLPDNLRDERDLADYLLTGKATFSFDDEYYKRELENYYKNKNKK